MGQELKPSGYTKIVEALRLVAGPIFAAVLTESGAQALLTVHASSGPERRKLKASILDSLVGFPEYRIRVRFHKPADLLSAKSLEAFVAKLGGQQIVYDPTGALVRAKGLVDASRAVRSSLNEHINGLYYAPLLRTFYVTLKKERVVSGDKVRLSDLASIQNAVLEAISSAFITASAECPAVRVGFGLPAASLVPVDRLSIMNWSARLGLAVRRYWRPITVAALFGFGTTTAAHSQEAAVSESNLKVKGSFGEVIDDYTWTVDGAFTAPLGERFGLQVEGGAGASGGQDYYGAAAHLFARDPESYLIGVFGAYSEGSDFNVDAFRTGGEFEFYLNQLTVSGTAGYQFSQTLGDKVFGSFDLKWYVTHNVAITAGALGDEDRVFGRGKLEWQPGFAALPGLAFHADGVWGDDDYQSIMGGLTYYFGSPASLKDRHRKQDPDSALFGLFQAVQAEQEKLCALYGGC